MGADRTLLPITFASFIADYSARSLWWATAILALSVVVAIFFARGRSTSQMLWRLPGSVGHPAAVAIAIIMAMMKNKSVSANVMQFQALCGITYMFQQYRIFRFWFGFRPVVVFFRPETVEVILSSNAILDKTWVYDFLNPWFKEGLITSSGSKWRKRRKLLTPAFHFRILEDFLPVIEEHAENLARHLQKEIGSDHFNMVRYITLCSLDILCETAMGKYVGALKDSETPYVKALYEASELFAFRLGKPWLWPEFTFYMSPHGKSFMRSTNTMNAFTRGVIRERKANVIQQIKAGKDMAEAFDKDNYGMKRRRAFLDLLLSQHLTDPGFTEDDIAEEVNTFMFAGHDTTAVGMSWALYLIGLHPDVQKKLHEEQDAIFGLDPERSITFDDLKELKYLECVLKESQRLYPSLPFIGRETTSDVDVNGHIVPRGTTCLVFNFMLHRNPEVFPNPEKFDPDRFLPENSTGRHPYAYTPFSAGPRNCIGQRFAMMEQKVILTHVLRNYNLESLDPRDKIRLTAEMVLRSFHGIRMRITPRNAS